ncbi:MAG: CDP-alcohol phosphatidyltransferase family protein [Legionellaceae bacterium]|nr:CDP-alcohol phosphatidyltransferase family protein [Legionellaceae bacterium]
MKAMHTAYWPMILKNIPNALTIARLVLIAPFIVLLYHHEYTNAFYLFILAGFTDCLDGWLARGFNWQSPFGTFIDPVADKLLITTSFIGLALIGKLPWWLVTLVFLRDITISVGVIAWFAFIIKKPDLKSTFISKINTVLQLLLVTLSLFELAFSIVQPRLDITLIILTMTTTSISFFDYVWTWGKKANLCLKLEK